MKRIELQIHGRVQGVAFRWSAQREALSVGLTGWVRNRLDGSVQVVAEGETEYLQTFLAWAHGGPDHAAVERVDVTWGDATDCHTTFEITG